MSLKPTTGYLLCGSPRSGSTLLCDLLRRSRVAGAPESYFRPASIAEYSQRWGLGSDGQRWDSSYVDAVRERGRGGTGCFGMRIMWSDMPAFVDGLKALYPEANDDRERLQAVLGIGHFVRLSRGDKVAQAVSLVIAAQTGLWHRNVDGTVREGVEPTEHPRYNHGLIADELSMLESEEHGWARWFTEHSITPLDLTYESLASDPAGTTQAVLGHVGSRLVDIPPIGTAKLATSLNAAWVERFNAERRSRT